MKYFLDTKFIENPGTIQLISIGVVGDDGHTFYAENTDFDAALAGDWVKDNVLSQLRWWGQETSSMRPGDCNSSDGDSYEVYGDVKLIKNGLLCFFLGDASPIFYGYYSDYDWVIFCWIFGRMIDLPKHFPKYCRDLKQTLDESGRINLPDPEGGHNALVDAIWNRDLYLYLAD